MGQGMGAVDRALDQSELLARAQRAISGGCLGMIALPDDLAMVMVRGEGARVWDAAGREYIDYMLGSGPLLAGHAAPEVVAAVRQAAALGSTFFALSEPVIRLAERLTAAIPCAEQVRFQTTGSEATQAALRLARAFTGRPKILKFEGGWHGGHDLGQISSAPLAPPDFPEPVADCDGVPPGALADVFVAPFNDLARTEQIADAHAASIAAILVEPLQRAIAPAPGFLAGLRRLADRIGCVLVFDEIVTGFRLAWGGAQERYGVTPDLACYGKAIAGGYPLSAVAGRRDILALSDPRRKGKAPYCFLSGTLTGNPVAAAAGAATLDILARPGTYARLDALAGRLREGLVRAGAAAGRTLQVLGDGPVLQVVFGAGPMRDHRAWLESDRALAVRFGLEMIRRGVYLAPGGKIYISTAHTEADIDATADRAAAALGAL